MNNAIFFLLSCVGFLGFFIIIFGFFAFWRYMQYREVVVLAEKGLVRPAPAASSGSTALRWGIVITALGVALSLGFYPLGFVIDAPGGLFPLHFGPWMLIGLVPLFFGLALILIYVVTRERKPEQEKEMMPTRESRTTPNTEAPGESKV